MKFITPIIVTLAAALSWVTARAQEAPVLTLDQCLEIALSENATVKVADMEIQRMDYSRRDVLAQLLPSLDFGVNYSRMLAKQVTYMDLDALAGMGGDNPAPESPAPTGDTGKDEGFKMGLDNSWQVGFNASVQLVAPQLWSSLKLSDTQIAQAVEQARASRVDLANQVRNAYYALQFATDSRRVIDESRDMAALTYETYKKQFELGAASEYDVLRASVALKNIDPQIVQADIAIRRARLTLAVLMGMDADIDFTVAGQLTDYTPDIYGNTLALSQDYSLNTNLVMNTLQTATAEQAVQVSRMAFLPTLAFTINYNWTSSSNGNPFAGFRWNPYPAVGLSLSVPLYQGGGRLNKVRQNKLQVEQLRLTRENLERSVSMQVDLAMDNIVLNVKQIASSSENVAQARRANDIMEESFAIGAASYLDLRDSQLALTQTRLAYNEAIYNYMIARSELTLLLGLEHE